MDCRKIYGNERSVGDVIVQKRTEKRMKEETKREKELGNERN